MEWTLPIDGMSAVSFFAVLFLTLLAGSFGLPWLRRLQVGQTVRDDGPRSHFKKSGTPTFGGFFFLLPIAVLAIYRVFVFRDLTLLPLLLFMFSLGLTGFIDDYVKVKVSKEGISVRQKSFLMLVFCTLFALYYLFGAPQEPFLRLPLSGRELEITGWFRWLYLVFIVVYLFFISNSVNLTDGVDGLAASVTVIYALTWALIAARLSGNAAISSGHLALMIAAGCLGFLWFNRHPAKVFMGDTGSQALGGGIAAIALTLGMPWLLLLVGFIYVVESLSVIMQVIYFKKTGGRRIFRMSPIHHHYELGGWSEQKIVVVFSLVALLSAVAGYLIV